MEKIIIIVLSKSQNKKQKWSKDIMNKNRQKAHVSNTSNYASVCVINYVHYFCGKND